MADEKNSNPDVEKKGKRSGSGAPPARLLKHAKDADEAMKAFEGHEGEILVLDEATNKRLLRKIDLNFMPVCLGYGRSRAMLNVPATMRGLWP